MTVAITSLNAYHGEVKDSIGKRQRQVLGILKTFKDLSNSEIAEILKWSINRVTPRVLELRNDGRVEYSRTRECNITGRSVKTWKVVVKK